MRLALLNLLLCAVLLATVALKYDELRWAWTQIEDYRQGVIDSPIERNLYLQAKKILQRRNNADSAVPLLNESIRIDPNSDAVFHLATSYRDRHQLEKAVETYERVLAFDYLHIDARLALVQLYRDLRMPEKASQVALTGARIFRDMAERSRPKMDRSVAQHFTKKAMQIYLNYHQAASRFNTLAEGVY